MNPGLGCQGCSLENESQPIDDVEYEEQDRERDEEKLVDPPVLLGQLLKTHGTCGGPLMHLILEIVLADDLDVQTMLAGHVALLFEQNSSVPEILELS